MSKKITVSDYLLSRLKELGIEKIFGVPGDYNLLFLDQIVNDPQLQWIGNCNELNAAYAADGYARVKGIGAIVTTFGVGELSAINGIAGAYAEYLPIVKIVGAPALSTQKEHAIMHHTLGTGDFTVFSNMYSHVTADQALLTPKDPGQEFDRVLRTCWIKKQPVYISLPSDLVLYPIAPPESPLDLSYPASNPEAVKELADRISHMIHEAKYPIVLLDICAVRHPMKKWILELIEKTGLHFASMNMGKGLLDESHPQFIGYYQGAYSSEGVQARVESSDCIISFGSIMSDFNTGGFSTQLSLNMSIEIHSHYVKIKHALYENVYFNALLPALIKQVSKHPTKEKLYFHPFQHEKETSLSNNIITQTYFWDQMEKFFKKGDVVVVETGTSLFGALPLKIPQEVTFVSQPLWGSIGYSVGALLGTSIADKKRRNILFVGDGSFQLTAQEVSTMLRHELHPIIFLLNNDGYTVERAIHGERMLYNDIQMWDYTALVNTFGGSLFSIRVRTPQELEDVLKNIPQTLKTLYFIEVVMDKDDCPEILKKIGAACALRNEGQSPQ